MRFATSFPRYLALALCPLTLLLCAATAVAEDPAPEDDEDRPRDVHFFGYETEPDMDYGGRTVSTLHSVLNRPFADLAANHSALAPIWEIPLGLGMTLIQHEVLGHGGRAREFDLHPSYGLGWGFSAYTTIDRDPESNEQMLLISSGGVEADMVLARRHLLDLYRPAGGEGYRVPLALAAKLDLSLYVSQTSRPRQPRPDESDSFVDQYEEGNDIALYVVSRQAQRIGADPAAVWNRTYRVDFDDPLLEENWDDARMAALWNVLDPSLWAAFWGYLKGHVIDGQRRIEPPVVQVSERFGLTLGTRAALGPTAVSRFLDFYAIIPRGIISAYVRDLDSSVDRSYGFGLGFHRAALGRRFELSVEGDAWDEPEALEALYDGSGWNLTAEVDTLFRERWGLTAKVGYKSDGYFPGKPLEEGAYAGFGVVASW